MTKIVAGSAATCDADTVAMELAEAAFILSVQSEIQRMMNEKGMRARDLAKRLAVSEARISQMFGDQAKNLTLRTIAKIFFQLAERPMITTNRYIEQLIVGAQEGEACWTVHGLVNDIHVGSGIATARDDTNVASPDRGRMVDQWARAEADNDRPHRLAAVR